MNKYDGIYFADGREKIVTARNVIETTKSLLANIESDDAELSQRIANAKQRLDKIMLQGEK